jgi:hypothetical protein
MNPRWVLVIALCMQQDRLCNKYQQVLSEAITAMTRHRAVIERAIRLQQEGNLTEEQRQEYRAKLAATFNEGQSAVDARRNHLIEHGVPLEAAPARAPLTS